MARFIEEGQEESQEIEGVVADIGADSLEQEETEVVQEQQQESVVEKALPEKYKGKSVDEIIHMHMEAEKLIGRQGSEVGELRKVVDDFIKAQTAPKQQLQSEPVEEVDFFADPQKAVEKAIENHPKIKQAEQLTLEMKQAKAFAELQNRHPDFQEVVADPAFQNWVAASKVRAELFVRADRSFDFDAGDELLSSWKERKAVASQTVSAEKQTRSQAIKSATTTVPSGSDESPSKKIYRRADIIKLMQTDPDRYDMMQPEIMAAYREGRVR
jgi:hypothetical protein